MRRTRRAGTVALIAAAVLVVGCGDSGTLFGGPSPTGVGTGGSAGSVGTSTSTGTGTSSGGAGAGTSSGGAGAGTSSGGGGGGTVCIPVGHDEDGDLVDDGCDNCPSYRNEGQLDSDQDGLGDACEAPGAPALWHAVERFEPFVAAPDLGWDLGEYSHSADELLIDTGFNTGRNADWLEPQTGTYSVETTFAYDGNESSWAGVRFANNGTSWWACLVERAWGTNGYRYNLGLWEFPGSGTTVLLRAEAEDVGSEPAGLPRRVRAHIRPGGNVLCTYNDPDSQDAAVEYQAGNTNGLVGFRAYNTSVHFFNFVVYE